MLTTEQIDSWDYYDMIGPTKTVPEMVREFARTMGQKKNSTLSETLIDEEYEEWTYEVNLQSSEVSKYYGEEYDPAKELKELSDLNYVIHGYADSRGWDLEESTRRVHENNMGRCIQPDGSIKRREDGKILKNKDYPKVQLGDLV